MKAMLISPVQILQALTLLHVRVKRERVKLEEIQDGTKSLERVDGVDKDDCTSSESKEEVVEKYIMWVGHGCIEMSK